MKPTLIHFLVTLYCTIALAFSGGCQPAKPQTVKVGYLPMVSSLTHFVALDKGYYTDENLEVKASVIDQSNGLARDLYANTLNAVIELSVVPLLAQQQTGASPSF